MAEDSDSDYYGGMSDPMQGESSDDMHEGEEDMHEEGETSLLPKSMFGKHEPKPGEEYIFKVVRLHEGEVEIVYSTGESKDKEKSSMEESMGGLDEMATENSGNPSGGY